MCIFKHSCVLVCCLLPIILGGCTSKRWKSHYHSSRVKFEQDSAFCQREANNTYNRARGNELYRGTSGVTTTTHDGYYDPYTGEYSGTSQTSREANVMANALDMLARSADADQDYELCMKSKGYYQTVVEENESPKVYVGGGSGAYCFKDEHCADGFLCWENKCLDTKRYNAMTGSEKSIVTEGECNDHTNCPDWYLCIENKCISNDDYLKM